MKKISLLLLLPLAGCGTPPGPHSTYQHAPPAYIAPPQPYLNPGYQMPINQPTITNCQRWGNQTTCTTR